MILTDRSRWEKGLCQCPRARYLTYDLNKVGLAPHVKSLPLLIGSVTHGLIEKMLKVGMELGRKPTVEEVKVAFGDIVGAMQTYADTHPANSIFIEQATLAVGMAWVFYFQFPWPKILMVEEEINVILGCGCGLEGQGDYKTHEARGCDGVVMMTRPDLVTEAEHGGVVVWDVKTSSYAESFQEQHAVQMALGSLGVEQKLGRPVTGYYIANLVKGRNTKDRGQQSPLCYGYLRFADEPLHGANVSHAYTRAKEYKKLPTHEILRYLYREVKPLEVMDLWVQSLMAERASGDESPIWGILGLYPRPDHLIEGLKAQVVSHEKEWAGRVWQVNSESDLDRLIPCSWKCYAYANSPCEFIPVCYKWPGYEDPSTMGMFKMRAPHHELEFEVLRDRGVIRDDPMEGLMGLKEGEWKIE